jgi:(2R)-ethylmalonyl-CoA mutase
MRLIADMVAYTVEHVPRWNPINICSYHLQEAGATPVQEIAYAMANAQAVLDAVRERVPPTGMGAVFGRSRSSSTPACASWRSTRSCARWASCGRSSGASATACTIPRSCASATASRSTRSASRSAQPENNVQRIVLEALA